MLTYIALVIGILAGITIHRRWREDPGLNQLADLLVMIITVPCLIAWAWLQHKIKPTQQQPVPVNGQAPEKQQASV